MATERLSKIEEDLDALTTIVAATARHAESAQESFGRLNDRIDAYIDQSQRIMERHEDRMIAARRISERLETISAILTEQIEIKL